MRSERACFGPWLGLALLALSACHNDDERVDDICARVAGCGQLRSLADCGNRLSDALTDGRTTDEGAAACAVCVSQPANTCPSLLITRDCDTACQGVDVITDMYTSSDDRLLACHAAKNICGVGDDAAGQACVSLLMAQISANPKLDRPLAGCVSCLRSAVVATVAQPKSNCDAMTCANECSDFPSIQKLFTEDSAVRSVCSRVALCNGTTGGPASANACLAAALAAQQTMVAACASCLNATQACSDIFPLADSAEAGAGASAAAAVAGVCDESCAGLPGFAAAGP